MKNMLEEEYITKLEEVKNYYHLFVIQEKLTMNYSHCILILQYKEELYQRKLQEAIYLTEKILNFENYQLRINVDSEHDIDCGCEMCNAGYRNYIQEVKDGHTFLKPCKECKN